MSSPLEVGPLGQGTLHCLTPVTIDKINSSCLIESSFAFSPVVLPFHLLDAAFNRVILVVGRILVSTADENLQLFAGYTGF